MSPARRKAAIPSELPDLGPEPARIRAAAGVADREERKQLLSTILRDKRATGAEAVAAARLLEAMERTDSGADSRGLPPPTNLAEQVARLTRVLTAAGPRVTLEALEIIARRYEIGRDTAFKNRALGLNPMSLSDVHLYGKRIKPDKEEHSNGASRNGERSLERTSGTATTDPDLSDLRGSEELAEQAAEQVEHYGERIDPAGTGASGVGAEDGEQEWSK